MTREAVEILRALVRAQPAAYRPNLAHSLDNLGRMLFMQSDTASRRQALAPAREAVAIYTQLHQAMPAAFERYLGMAQRSLRHIEGQR